MKILANSLANSVASGLEGRATLQRQKAVNTLVPHQSGTKRVGQTSMTVHQIPGPAEQNPCVCAFSSRRIWGRTPSRRVLGMLNSLEVKVLWPT